jgi:hypothetical protein
MRVLAIALIASAGCVKKDPLFCEMNPNAASCAAGDGGIVVDDGRVVDAPDVPVDANPCVGSGSFAVCFQTPPSAPQTLSGTIDTDNDSLCSANQLWQSPGQTPACFVLATSIAVANASVTGSRPLVLFAVDTIDVTGHLDAASHVVPPATGPGVPATPCGAFTATPQTGGGAGGGAGASLAPGGGGGGQGGTGNNGATTAGAPYAPFLAIPPGTLRGGCDGQSGANGQGTGGTGGRGGGAVYLIAGGQIALGASSVINASGAGAPSAGKQAGGGGGGSGGMILLHAPAITVTTGAKLLANGGGGGSGGSNTMAGLGSRGNDPDPTNPLSPGTGGVGANGGGNGGNGFAEGALATSGSPGGSQSGGGGGGGAGGYIQTNIALTGAVASPAPNLVP